MSRYDIVMPMSRLPKSAQCEFCGGTPLNDEHVLGKWSKPFLSRLRPNYKQLRAVQHANHSDLVVRHRAGDPASLKVRCACVSCNGGWMSELQNDMKPLGIAMATGKTVRLDGPNQIKIAAWAAMVAMTSEYDHYPDIVIAKTDKDFLRLNGYPLNRFRIWLGRVLPGTWDVRWVRHPFAILNQEEPAVSSPPPPHALNTLLTTHVLGQMFVHVMYCVHEDILHDWALPWMAGTKLIQIWPTKNRSEYWPPFKPLTPEQASLAASAFYQFSIQSRRQHRIAKGLDPNI